MTCVINILIILHFQIEKDSGEEIFGDLSIYMSRFFLDNQAIEGLQSKRLEFKTGDYYLLALVTLGK